ncbi:MAG: hypothetical protein F8N37_18420 [Telmatospirillum sp.]|nr:hypothetical protein [Telmatospirillum sp.]
MADPLPPAPGPVGPVHRGGDGSIVATRQGGPIRVCPTAGPGCDATSLAAALADAPNGSTIVLAAGVYRQGAVIAPNAITLSGEDGARIEGGAVQGKAALVVTGNDTVITGIDCSGISVPDHNGACVRLEGRNLTLRHVHFHDSEEGILTGGGTGTVTVEDSLFERLGAGGRAHGLYIGDSDALILRRTSVLASTGEGHEVKSRAARTTIDGCVIASLGGVDSRLIDASNGGIVTITGSVLEKGPASANDQLIGFGLEGFTHSANSLTIDTSIVIKDRSNARLVLGDVAPSLSATKVIGGTHQDAGAAQWFPSRDAAGMGAYPYLPPAPGATSPR